MSSSAAAFLVRRALSTPPLFLRLRRRPSLFYSSLASSPFPFSSPSPARAAAVPLSSARASSFSPLRFASSKVSADETLKRVIDSEIDCVVQSDDHSREVDLPDGFPFEIIDNPGDQTVVLKRELAGETIEATVFMNYDEEQDLNGEDEGDVTDDGNDEASIKPTISLVVTIEKGEGPFLEFCCNLHDDKLEIESMSIKKRDDPDAQNAYEGPEFSDLDESLQAALRRYLEARGIKHSMYDFLHEYMINKDEREYLTWLKNMREFIAELLVYFPKPSFDRRLNFYNHLLLQQYRSKSQTVVVLLAFSQFCFRNLPHLQRPT